MTAMWRVIGQDKSLTLLKRGIERGTLAHAYLFAGPPHVGKLTLATDLACALNCESAEPPCGTCSLCARILSGTHADIQIIGVGSSNGGSEERLRTEISIDQIREMQHSASLPPFEGNNRLYIIDGAEFMSEEAANCLLKTLEEPLPRVYIILLTAGEERIPATVRSRCQRLELAPMPVDRLEEVLAARLDTGGDKARLLSRLAHGRVGWAFEAVENDALLAGRTETMEQLLSAAGAGLDERFALAGRLATQYGRNRDGLFRWLEAAADFWRDLMLITTGKDDMITNIDYITGLSQLAGGLETREAAGFVARLRKSVVQIRQNANVQLVLEVLMLDMPGKEAGRPRMGAAGAIRND